jgi:hypothetical protein
MNISPRCRQARGKEIKQRLVCFSVCRRRSDRDLQAITMQAAHRSDLCARNDMQMQERVGTGLACPCVRVAIDVRARIRWLAIAPAFE